MIPHNRPTLGDEEKKAAGRVIESRWLAQGSEVEAFEDELCAYLGLGPGHAVALSSGTAALYMSLWALDAGGKTVAVPVYACSALRNAVIMAGGKEILLDISHNGPNVPPTSIHASGATVAIVPHMFGMPIDLSGLRTVDVVEDCAQALGASVRGVPVGLQGRIGIYSFYATKLMTSGGQGGMLVSRNRSLVDSVRDYRDFDCRRDHKPRFNFQLTDLQAAIGRVQLLKLPLFLSRRAEIFERYRRAQLSLLDHRGAVESVRYRAVLRTSQPQVMIEALSAKGIKAIVPVADWELLGEGSTFPNALALCRHSVSLPIYPSLSDEEADAIAAAAAEV